MWELKRLLISLPMPHQSSTAVEFVDNAFKFLVISSCESSQTFLPVYHCCHPLLPLGCSLPKWASPISRTNLQSVVSTMDGLALLLFQLSLPRQVGGRLRHRHTHLRCRQILLQTRFPNIPNQIICIETDKSNHQRSVMHPEVDYPTIHGHTISKSWSLNIESILWSLSS